MKDSFPFPVARIGVIGGGQLGRMMVKAAKRIGCTCVVLDPYPMSPAGQVAGHQKPSSTALTRAREKSLESSSMAWYWRSK